MKIILNAKEYKEICVEMYKLISTELENPQDLEASYPKLVIMYEFFRLLRGEAFTEFREPTPEFQKELYTMEEEVFKRLKELKTKIPENSSKAKHCFENLISQGLKI